MAQTGFPIKTFQAVQAVAVELLKHHVPFRYETARVGWKILVFDNHATFVRHILARLDQPTETAPTVYSVELTAKAYVRQRHQIVAACPEEAVLLAKEVADNHEWQYDGLTDDPLEGNATPNS